MVWHAAIIRRLRESSLFADVRLLGGKIRAFIKDTLFLDLHFDPITGSYSYALIDLTMPFAGDKRVFGWDDFPHLGVPKLMALSSYPHHFQRRADDGRWQFAESSFRGDIHAEVEIILMYLRDYLKEAGQG